MTYPACIHSDCPICDRPKPDPGKPQERIHLLNPASPVDPLVADIVGWLRGGGDSPASDDVARTAGKIARLSAVLAAARAVVASHQAIEAMGDRRVPACATTCGSCGACQESDRLYAEAAHLERVLVGTEVNLCNAIAAADGAR